MTKLNINIILNNIGNPFSNIKKVPQSQELLDIAFSKSMKAKPPGGRFDPIKRSRLHEINRINTVANILTSRLENIVKEFPSINLIHPFYLELLSIMVDVDKLKFSLGRINGCIKTIRDIEFEINEKILLTKTKMENKKLRKIAFGRISSVIYQISNELLYISETREKCINIPSFNPYLPCVVISGIPNSGKSSFIKSVTSGKPEISNYPFTTKKLIFGHRKVGFTLIQFVDTPGLLDRNINERNEIELQAIAALKHISDILIFLIDASDNTGFELEEQFHLLLEIHNFYPSIVFIPVVSKIDTINEQRFVQIKNKLIELGVIEVDQELYTISNLIEGGTIELMNKLEDIVKHELIENIKFKLVSTPKIADDQYLDEQYYEI